MAMTAEFLDFKPSHQAAAACILAFNIYNCPAAAVDIGLALKQESVVSLAHQLKQNAPHDPNKPLASWSVFEKTSLIQTYELEEVYGLLVKCINKKQFKNKLAAYPMFWLPM